MSKTQLSHSQGRTLAQWLSYIEKLHATEIDLGLSRMATLVKRLAINFDFAKVITVAGTNGKGTTCALLENAFLELNDSTTTEPQVAVYSSPHIEKFNERLRIDLHDVDDERFIQAFELIEAAREGISLTYYEYTTLAAFLIIMQSQPRYIILEVGLGGRLDATNIIDADVAVITSIDLDHQAFLGNTREAIGFEKAGIFRDKQMVVIGDESPPQSVVKHAKQLNTQAYIRDRDFSLSLTANSNNNAGSWCWHFKNQSVAHLHMPKIPMSNVATALMVLQVLQVVLSTKSVNNVIAKTAVPGRLELFSTHCNVILDVAHNPQAARYLASYLSSPDVKKKYRQVNAVVGILVDKDIKNTLLPLVPIINHWYIGNLATERSASSQYIGETLSQFTHSFNCFDNVTHAFKIASDNSQAKDLIIVFGSFYTVAEIRRLLI